MTKMKRIMFDIDGCLADFMYGFTSVAHDMFSDAPVVKGHNYETWSGYGGLSKEQIHAVWEAVRKSPSFWATLPPLVSDDELKGISDLSITNEVYFVTAREGYNRKQQTETWLREHGIEAATVVICKRKGEFCKAVDIDYAIDDKASNVSYIDWSTEGRTKSCLLDRPYNQVPNEFLASGVHRVSTISQFLEAIKNGN